MPKNDMKLIMLYMSGGMSHMDTFDLKPGIPEAGQSKPISTSASGVRISNYLEVLCRDQLDEHDTGRARQGKLLHAHGIYQARDHCPPDAGIMGHASSW